MKFDYFDIYDVNNLCVNCIGVNEFKIFKNVDGDIIPVDFDIKEDDKGRKYIVPKVFNLKHDLLSRTWIVEIY